MKLSRAQELFLIDLGLSVALDRLASRHDAARTANKARFSYNKPLENHVPPKSKRGGRNKGKKWTKTQRKRFAATMKKKWAEKRAAESKS